VDFIRFRDSVDFFDFFDSVDFVDFVELIDARLPGILKRRVVKLYLIVFYIVLLSY